jgi:hypothetical protein
VKESQGSKAYSYFWIEMNPAAGKNVATVRPVQGDWWSVRKDAKKRGGGDTGSTEAEGGRVKKEKEEDDSKPRFQSKQMQARFQRLTDSVSEV